MDDIPYFPVSTTQEHRNRYASCVRNGRVSYNSCNVCEKYV